MICARCRGGNLIFDPGQSVHDDPGYVCLQCGWRPPAQIPHDVAVEVAATPARRAAGRDPVKLKAARDRWRKANPEKARASTRRWEERQKKSA